MDCILGHMYHSTYVQSVSVGHSAKAKQMHIYNVSMWFSLDLTADGQERLEVPVFVNSRLLYK